MLSDDKNPPAREVFEAGVLPCIVANLAEKKDYNDLIRESCWVLTNIASTSCAPAVVQTLAVVPLASLLVNFDPDIREQAVWCLANIAGDDVAYRDDILISTSAVLNM
jgi:importin subunit alpha-1